MNERVEINTQIMFKMKNLDREVFGPNFWSEGFIVIVILSS